MESWAEFLSMKNLATATLQLLENRYMNSVLADIKNID